MKKAIAMRWIEALRSGEYGQTQGTLRDDEGFCCLGVLCNLHAQDHPDFAATQLELEVYDGESGVPSDRVMEWAGLRNPRGWCDGMGDALTEMNDSGYSFDEIADTIEKHWRDL